MEKTIEERIVLIDKQNKVLGTAPKLVAHNVNTPLHRGFSLFLFNKKGMLLLQQRSKTKKTFPLIWSNSLCGHPMLNESNIQAAKRRLSYELGINGVEIFEVLTDYKYKASMNDIYENEICPVLVCFTDRKPKISKEEIEKLKWIGWQDFLKEINDHSGEYSIWCEQEVKLLAKNKEFVRLYKKFTKRTFKELKR